MSDTGVSTSHHDGTGTTAPTAEQREREHLRVISESALFDASWYSARYPEVAASGLSPELHYLRKGAPQGFVPSPRFDGAAYLARYQDIARTGMNPLVHFVLFGAREGRVAIPADPEEIKARQITASGLFDEAWYLRTYPEVAGSGLAPVRFFLRHGREKNHNPGPHFDSAGYIARNADVASSKINPLLHYLQFGMAEGREINDVAVVPEPPPPPPPPPPTVDASALLDPAVAREEANARIIRGSSLFDAEWYHERHPEVAKSGLPPELHYLRLGAAKGLPPSRRFDAEDYVAQYRDVRETGINPVIHFELFGRAEKRKIKAWDEDRTILRMVSGSGFFDEAWYLETYPEVRNSKMTPIGHFIRHGRAKGHSPGPDFDAAAYVAGNPDVAASTVNALVHYLFIGQQEGRQIYKVPPAPPMQVAAPEPEPPQLEKPAEPAPQPPKPQEPEPLPPAPEPPPQTAEEFAADLALIQDSPFFDRGWYLARNPEVVRSGMGAAEHYLRHGGTEMRQPSLLFDPQYYVIEQSPEIQRTGINPLLHFIKVGQAMGLKPRALFESIPGGGPVKPLSPAAWPLAAAPDPVPEGPSWITHAELSATPPDGSILAGKVLLALPSDPSVREDIVARIVTFAGLSGSADITVRTDGTAEAIPLRLEPNVPLSEAFTTGPAMLADGWYATDRILRLRFGEDNAAESDPVVLRAFQCGADGTREPAMIGEALLSASGPDFVDLALVNPYMPVLLVLAKPDGDTIEAGLIPFPSLLRGGLHHSELVGASQLSDPRSEFRTLSRQFLSALCDEASGASRLVGATSLATLGASGTEPMFQEEFLAWASRLFGVVVRAAETAPPSTPGEAHLRRTLGSQNPLRNLRRTGQFDLILPPDSVPCLSALTAPAAGCDALKIHAGNYFVADEVRARPRLSVQLPAGVALDSLQPGWQAVGYPQLVPLPGANAGDYATLTLPHLAIRFPASVEQNRAALLMPLAPDYAAPVIARTNDAATIDAVIRVSDAKRLAAMLGSLLRQTGIEVARVRADIVMGTVDTSEIEAVLEGLIPGRGTIRIVRQHLPIGPASLTEETGSAFTLVGDDSVVLHDPRCVSSLAALAASEGTASASCTLLREIGSRRSTSFTFESGGYFPSHVSLLSAPTLILSLPDCRQALPNMTYPVIANDPALVLLSNGTLRRLSTQVPASSTAGADIFAFSLAALAAGYRHLCTTAVRASVLGAPPPREATDPPGLSAFTPGDWQRILSAVTVLRELH